MCCRKHLVVMREEFTKSVRRDAFVREGGHCMKCRVKLGPLSGVRYDHIVPWEFSRDSSVGNCAPLCKTCDAQKTYKQDIPAIAKSNRLRDKHVGIKKRSSFSCSRDSKWKKKIDGTVVPR